MTDKERLDWLESMFFDKHWDGTIGRMLHWSLVGHYRHELMKMRGLSLREAIDFAINSTKETK